MSTLVFEITFKGTEDLLRLAQERAQLLDANVRAAVARTVLWGAARIAEDCPVDTGRLRASILGYLAQKYGIPLAGSDRKAIEEGMVQSVTQIDGYEGRIGTNVRYALPQEYGVTAAGPKTLTEKQRKYLFAAGILKNVKGRVVLGEVNKRINRRAGQTYRVKGKGFFRRNKPLIDRYFQEQMREAVRFTERGQLMPVTF